MLSHLRVLDLTDGGASIAGRIFADLGADVVLVEPPGGVASRRRAPFAEDIPDPDRSLEFWANHRGKRSLELDLESPSDRDRLRRWVSTTDVWIDDRPVDELAGQDLAYDDLVRVQPGLVHASITPFGEIGPKRNWAATDLIVTAASNAMWLTGDADRPPLTCSVPQAFYHAGAEAAAAALLALFERERSGRGQHIDVSAQTAMMASCQSNVLAHGWNDRPLSRSGGGVALGPHRLRFIYECLDGYVNFTLLFGEPIGHATARFFDWMDEEGCSNDSLRAEDWVRYGTKLFGGHTTIEAHEEVMAAIERFTRTKTKAELLAGAFERRLLIVPLSDCRDLLESRQLSARAFWRSSTPSPLDREVFLPGPFARFSATPLDPPTEIPRLGAAAPAPTPATRPPEPATTTPGARPSGSDGEERPLPLAGLKILDFTWVYAGPATTRQLADAGATVIKIESMTAPDALRSVGPYKDGKAGTERSGNFANVNLGKQSLGLNLKMPAARELVLRLVDWADVVVENFSPRAMKAWGFDYESLRDRKPDLVMLSSSLSGATGPEASLAGYGTMGSALAGFGFLTGWPDRRPAAPYMAYTDYIAPRFAVAALLAALEHRRRTGVGQSIDLAQAECSIHFLGSSVLDHAVNGRIARARGNDDREIAPSGVYPASGRDRWIAIAAPDAPAWEGLAREVGDGWERDPRFSDPTRRLANRRALDERLANWTARHRVGDLEARLQSIRVPAHRVSTPEDAFNDPQLAAREHFRWIEHPELGLVPCEAMRARFSGTPGRPGPCPTLGQHNADILGGVLALSDEEITELVIAGAIE